MENYKVKILHLFPDLLNLYGDKGNIETLRKRLIWRGIDAEVMYCTAEDERIDFENADIILLGGGFDREVKTVLEKLFGQKTELAEFVENGGTMLALCSGFEMLGKHFYLNGEKTAGLGVLDAFAEIPADGKRITGNVVLECDEFKQKITGFENHEGRMMTGILDPLGIVVAGCGNNGEDKKEGAVYKNLIATYLHGPLLPKNPELCDRILANCLKHKYPDFTELEPIDDGLEVLANDYMVKISE